MDDPDTQASNDALPAPTWFNALVRCLRVLDLPVFDKRNNVINDRVS